MMPSREDVLRALDQLDTKVADELETEFLEFKPWLPDPKANMAEAIEYSVCFANKNGGVIVFGVKDRTRGRANAVTGCTRYDLDVWRRGIYDGTRPNLTVDIEELGVPEGMLLLVRVPKCPPQAYGTSSGVFKIRVGKNCMPMDPATFQRLQVAAGAIDWSAEIAEKCSLDDVDPVEVARLRNILKAKRPSSTLNGLKDSDLLKAIGALRDGKPTRACILTVGTKDALSRHFPQHEMIYLYLEKKTEIEKRENLKAPLLHTITRVEELLKANNPIRTLKAGLFHIDIPAYPDEVVREALLNALIHRDYLAVGSVYVRHLPRELVVSNPGGFVGGITPKNILHAEAKQRNRLLAEIFEKIGLVERAGIGRQRIFIPTLAFGKRPPVYEADEHTVKLTIFDGTYDEALAGYVAERQRGGHDFEIDELLLLAYLREHPEIDVAAAAEFCQRPQARIRDILDRLSQQKDAWLERRGRKGGVTYHLTRGAAAKLASKAAYTKARGIDPIRFPEMIRAYVAQHGSINNSECRELLGLGNSATATVKVSRLLHDLPFLEPFGTSPKTRRYRMKKESAAAS